CGPRARQQQPAPVRVLACVPVVDGAVPQEVVEVGHIGMTGPWGAVAVKVFALILAVRVEYLRLAQVGPMELYPVVHHERLAAVRVDPGSRRGRAPIEHRGLLTEPL